MSFTKILTNSDKILLNNNNIVSVTMTPPGPLIPTDDNEVRWAIYDDGTLVINGNNEPNYNDHGEVTFCSDSYEYRDFPSEGFYQAGLLNLNQTYDAQNMMEPYHLPWNGGHYVLGTRSYASEIRKVEFARTTTPTNMVSWFMDCIALEEIDITNLNFSKLTDISFMFRMSYNRTAPLPSFANWDVSHVTSAKGCFVMFDSDNGSCSPASDLKFNNCPGNESDNDTSGAVILDLRGWNLCNSCDATGMFSLTTSYNDTFLGDNIYSPINAIFCENTWDISSSNGNVFLGLGLLFPFSYAHDYDNTMVGPEMACPGPSGYFEDPSIIA